MTKYWIKLYHEILDDPKMGRLPDRYYRRVIELFLLAGEVNAGGNLPPIDDMAWRLRLDPAELETELQGIEQTGIVHLNNDGNWHVTKFAERQDADTSSERGKYYRARNREQSWAEKIYTPLPDSPGIYEIVCTKNGKRYIGGSKNIRQRIAQHLSEMRSGINRLSADFKQYGESAFVANVLELCDLDGLEEKEDKYIQQYDSGVLYNTDPGKQHRSWSKDKNRTNRSEIPNESFVDIDIDIDIDKELDIDSSNRPNIFALYEQTIGIMNPTIRDELVEAEKEYPPDWIEDAFRETARQNKHNWKYTAAILKSWKENGSKRIGTKAEQEPYASEVYR